MAGVLSNYNELDAIVTKLYLIPLKVQFCHHLTLSYAAHKALDFAYDKLNDLKDDIVEKMIGYTGQRFSKIDLKPLSGYSENMNIEVCKDIMTFGSQLESWASSKGFCDIENIAQEYSGVGAKLSYLLTLK